MDSRPIAVNAAAIKRTRSEHYREVYANVCQGRLGAFDISLSFYLTKEPETYDGLINEEQVTISMSPPQFKLVAELCAGLAAAYEQAFAPIVVPADARNPNLDAEKILEMIKGARAAQAEAAAKEVATASTTSSSTSRKRPVRHKKKAP